MDIEEFEKCFISIWPHYTPNVPFHDWFMQNHNAYHGSYDILQKKRECLAEIYNIWLRENRQPIYFWLSTTGISYSGRLSSINSASIVLDDAKIKQLYRNEILNDMLR